MKYLKISKFEYEILRGLDDAAHNRLLVWKNKRFIKVPNYGKTKVKNCKLCKRLASLQALNDKGDSNGRRTRS